MFLRKGLSAISRMEADDDEEDTPESRRERADLAAMLAMTLHNAAVQHEHLEQWKHALAAYQCAANCATECLGTEHSITVSLTTACKEATRTIAKKTGIVKQGSHRRNSLPPRERAASPPPQRASSRGGSAGSISGHSRQGVVE